MFKPIYESNNGRAILGRRGRVYSVVIAGEEYGFFSWREALEWYRRHKGSN